MAPLKVAIAGATGNLGVPILDALLDANFPVTVLTRKGSSNASKLPSNPNITIKEVDYGSVSDLTAALKGIDAVVSTLATEVVGTQTLLIDAAIAAGVSRFIPSEFGSDTANPKTAALPVFKFKVDTAKYLQSKVAENPSFSYTLILNGAFFDWGLQAGFVINPAKHSAVLYDGGDRPFSTTTLATIGKAVVGVLNHLPETANRPVYVHDTATTLNKLIGYAKEKDGKEWDVSTKSTDEIFQESFAELQKGKDANIGAAMVGFIRKALYGEGYGGDYTGRTDNALLGIPEKSEAEVKALVQSFV